MPVEQTSWHKVLLMLLWGLVLQVRSSSTEAESMVCWFQMDGVTPALSKEKPGTSQVWKKQPVFSFDDMSAGTWHLCSSETGSSLVWKEKSYWMQEHLQKYPKVVSEHDWLLVSEEKGLWFPKKRGSRLCITPREAWGCFLWLTQVSFETDYGIWENVALSPERLGDIFDLT